MCTRRGCGEMAVPELLCHSRSLFISDLGPMRFYVRPGPLKRQLSPLITSGGGIMCSVQEPGAFLLADPGEGLGIQYISSSYITDCVRSNRRLSPRSYRLLNRRGAGPEKTGAGAPDRAPRRTLSPGKSHGTRGRREGVGHTGLERDPNSNVCPLGAPTSRDPGPKTGDHSSRDPEPPASRDPGPKTGAPASRDPGPKTGDHSSCDPEPPASRDPGPKTGAPASRDPGPKTGDHSSCDPEPPASRDPGPKTGAPASCDPEPPASRDPGPKTGDHSSCDPEPPASRDPGPKTGAPASRDPGPKTGAPASRDTGASASCHPAPNTGALASCDPEPPASGDPGPNTGAPASCDPEPNTGAPTSCDHKPNTGAPASRDPGPSGVSAMKKESAVEQMQRTGRDPIGLRTHRGRCATEDPRTKVSLQDTVPNRIALGRVGRVRFSRQEDIVILQYVQENEGPNKPVTGNLLWKELEKKQLVQRTWQAMKCRYKMHILPKKHLYKLLPRPPAPGKTPRTSAGATGDITAPQHDLPPADTSPRSASSLAAGSGGTRKGELCKDVSTDDDGSPPEGSTATRRRRVATNASTEKGKGKKESTYMKTQPPEEQDTDQSEELQIFEIANMEFEVGDEDSDCKVKVPALSLKDFVMGEDSMSAVSQVDMSSSHEGSDSEDLQDALTDMMSEFGMDLSQVTQALLKNSGELGSTRHFLRSGRRPDGFPIWEHEDDVWLQRNDPSRHGHLVRKYGADNVAIRVAFLAS
ncbi:telomeric repeat-binding factor 2-interacting protein 1-like [Ranitomeya variabilis]|uniref:telomeric repeat-binding factor 2-interacting protein 1-like n=1 Tax=Ranitomeya variabilis TaxID=490064 RepID=UPI004057191D